jgi:hypothetical protein
MLNTARIRNFLPNNKKSAYLYLHLWKTSFHMWKEASNWNHYYIVVGLATNDRSLSAIYYLLAIVQERSVAWCMEGVHNSSSTYEFRLFSISFRERTASDHLIGPHELLHWLTGALDCYFLPGLTESVSIAATLHSSFMHERAPPHYSRAIYDYLNTSCPERLIDLYLGHQDLRTLIYIMWAPVKEYIPSAKFLPWPPRSPDLNLHYVGTCKGIHTVSRIFTIRRISGIIFTAFVPLKTSLLTYSNFCFNLWNSCIAGNGWYSYFEPLGF